MALSAFFLRFFVPQVLLYAIGTVATAVLFAKRRFVIVAVAPIANAVILVATMAIFRAMHGPNPGLDLTTGEELVLAIGGTLGVVGFVAVPTIALLRSGFRLRATLGAVDRHLRRLLWLSAWVALQPDVAVLLGAALVMGNQVAGGVVAYQFCFVAFLAPYAILAQPIHTTILPELTVDAASGDMVAFADRIRWGLDGMSRLLLPVSAAYVALALPAMRVLAVGNSRNDAELFAAVLASLGVGLFTYGTFLFFAARVVRAGRQPHAGDHRRARARSSAPASWSSVGSRSRATRPRSPRSGSGTARRTSWARSCSARCCASGSATGSSRTRSCPRSGRRSRSAAPRGWSSTSWVRAAGSPTSSCSSPSGSIGLGALRAAAAHAAQARRSAGRGVRTDRSRPRGRTVIRPRRGASPDAASTGSS